MKWWFVSLVVISTLIGTTGCENEPASSPALTIAEDIFAPQGAVLPSATNEQKETFRRGEEVVKRRFTPETGLGPLFNVTFCGAAL